jgi:hypothetical protein
MRRLLLALRRPRAGGREEDRPGQAPQQGDCQADDEDQGVRDQEDLMLTSSFGAIAFSESQKISPLTQRVSAPTQPRTQQFLERIVAAGRL